MFPQNWQELLLKKFSGEQTRDQLIRALGLLSTVQLRRDFIRPALQEGLVEETIPDKPNSIHQRYRLTKLGRETLRQLRKAKVCQPQLTEIISGGQTGVDRGALDAAIAREIPYSGWVPQGRLTEDGPLPDWYQMTESDSPKYAVRTRLNVQNSDGTLILYPGILSGGTALTVDYCVECSKPYYLAILPLPKRRYGRLLDDILLWARRYGVRRLNVAGPRESGIPGIYVQAKQLIESLLDRDRFCAQAGRYTPLPPEESAKPIAPVKPS